jgi:LPXTG-site transpeptidase (sortase) family protein
MQKQFIYKISSALMIVMLALAALPMQAAQARPLAAVCGANTNLYRSAVATGNWAANANWQTSSDGGATWGAAGCWPSSINGAITIQNGHNITVAAPITVDQVTINSGGKVTIASGITWTIANGTGTDLTVDGTVTNAGTITTTGATVVFNNGGLYEHNFTTTAGVIPTATWNTGSTVAVIGYTSNTGNLAGFAGQTFYNFTWNSTSQTGAIAIGTGNYTTNINGNFTIASTGSGVLHLRKTGAAAVPVINITGDLIVQAGIFDLMNDGGLGNQVSTMNIAGNFNMTGGTVQTNTTQTGSYGVMNFSGANKTFTQSGGTFNGGTSRININVNNGASLTMNNNIPTLTGYGVTVVEGGTLNTGTNIVSGTGTFTVSNAAPGGTLGIGSLLGITSSGATGNIQTSTRTFNTGANYTYNGSGAQATGNGLPATVRNLTVNNSAGVSLTNSVTVSNALNFSSGRITTGANTIILPVAATVGTPGAGNYAFGNVQRAFTGAATSFTFPIGDATNYAPVALTFGSVTTPGTVTASVTNAACGAPGIDSSKNVNHCWTLTNNLTAPTNYTATFNFAGVGTDADAGATFGNFIVGKNDSGTWTYPTVGTKSATSTQATGMTTMSSFEVGEPASTAPTVTTPTSASISTTGATLGGNITSNGGGTITARGTCWATTATPRTNCVAEGGTATGVFTQVRTGFTAGQTYYYAAYATNSAGTGYSADGTFTANSILTVTGPASTTYPATGTLAASGGLGGGGLTFNYVSGGCSIGGTTLTITNASSTPCVVNVTRAAGGAYLAQTSANFNAAMVRAPASATVTNSPQNYTGSGQSATVTCTGGGAASSILTGGAATQTNAGTYAVTANCAASNNYAAGTAVVAGNFTINPATDTPSVSNSGQLYTGSAIPITVSCASGGTATSITPSSRTNAGTSAVTASCPGNSNYSATTGASAGNFTINPATPTATISNNHPTYTGLAQTATVACLGGGTATLASGGTGTDAGPYPTTVNCAASTDYVAANGLNPGDFVIDKASSTVIVTCPATVQTYTGSAITPCTVAVTGANLSLTPTPDYTDNVSVGTATARYTYIPDANHTTNTGSATFVIGKASQTINVTTNAPTLAMSGVNFTVAATGGASGNPVTYGASGSCTNSDDTFTTGASGTCTVHYNQAGDDNYDAAPEFTQNTVVDGDAPTVVSINLNTPATSPTNAASVVFRITFSEPVTGVDPANFALVSTGVTGPGITPPISGTGTTRDVTVNTGSGDGTIGLNLANGTGIVDLAGNALGTSSFTGQVYTIQKSGPTVSIGAPSVVATVTGPVNFPITITGATTVNLTAGNVTRNTTGTATGTISVTNGTTNSPTVTISSISGDGTLGISISTLVAFDSAVPDPNTNLAVGPSATFLVDTTAPQVAASGIGTIPDTGDGVLTEFEVATVGITKFSVTFNEDLVNVGIGDPQYGNSVINPANYMLIRDLGDTAGFQTVSCAPPGAVVPADTKIDISDVTYDNSTHVATFTVNGGLPLSNGNYQLYVCGSTSIMNLAGIELAGDGTRPGTDRIRNFIVSISGGGGGNNRDGRGKNSGKDTQTSTTGGLLIPVTGFAPDQVTLLPVQPADKVYKPLDEIRIDIPTLGINFPIVGVSFIKNNWDLTWLNGKVGYLEGSAYPTFIGNTVLTAHVTEPNNNLGPFSDIKGMQAGQKIYLHAFGQVYVYQVQENRKIKPTDVSAVFKHEEYDWVTLVTCEDYNTKTKTYDYRRMVRAVLISVIPEK